jgi:malate dehydrogenase (oxaloacetate-decarboxylating)(NADP+)
MKKLDQQIKKQLYLSGYELLHNPVLNKGTAFTEKERDTFGLRGLLPPHVHTQKEQIMRTVKNFRAKTTPLSKYIYLMGVKSRNETLFYRTLIDHIEEMMPIVYTPTIGEVCLEYGDIFRGPQGLFISIKDKGRVEEVLRNWPYENVKAIVVTDGERILGLGDLGANGMGIPVGKLSLYTACAGIAPTDCLPITIDVGTNNTELLKNTLYIGTKRSRVKGKVYDELLEEFFVAVKKVFPDTLIQLEDFATHNAFGLLNRYRNDYCVFNDDIQGTAAVAVAGIYSSLRITGKKLADQKILFMGMGEAGLGIGRLFTAALREEGLTEAQAKHHCWFFDSKGLVVKNRQDLNSLKQEFAHDHHEEVDFLKAIKTLKPTAIIGVCGQPKVFTQAVIEEMSRINDRPVIFAFSNPSSKAECTATQAYTYSQGKAIFASGSPFSPVTIGQCTLTPGQGNNAYIFPGVGLGVIACLAKVVLDEMFLAAAKTLANEVTSEDLKHGRIYPPLTKIRAISVKIATEVAKIAYTRKIAGKPRPRDLEKTIKRMMYEPNYKKLA